MSNDGPFADLLLAQFSRCTLPLRQVEGAAGTAFLYNELVEDTVREWLITTDTLTRCEAAEFRLRPDMIEPSGAASDFLTMFGFAKLWARKSNVAAMRTFALHQHADEKGWQWKTQEITEGVAATAEHAAAIGPEPHKAYALGHVVTDPGSGEQRPQALATSNITRDPDRVVRWQGSLPEGFAGAPVFIAEHLTGREFAVRCVGLIANGDPNSPVITFDTVRAMIARTVQISGPRGARNRLARLFPGLGRR